MDSYVIPNCLDRIVDVFQIALRLDTLDVFYSRKMFLVE